MGKASQTKGYRGETLWVRFLQRLGFTATREKRKQGGRGGGASDVVSNPKVLFDAVYPEEWETIIPIPIIHWEVKNTATLPPKGVRNALMQARAAANGGPCGLAMHIPGTSHFGIYFETSDWELSDFGLKPQGDTSQ